MGVVRQFSFPITAWIPCAKLVHLFTQRSGPCAHHLGPPAPSLSIRIEQKWIVRHRGQVEETGKNLIILALAIGASGMALAFLAALVILAFFLSMLSIVGARRLPFFMEST